MVHAVAPDPGVGEHLRGATFIDAFRLSIRGAVTAEAAARAVMEDPPQWISGLLALRNLVVTPLGLKTGRTPSDTQDWIGIFPVESVTANRIVLGFDDRHLDFRVVLDVAAAGDDSEITVTTLVREHNFLGRIYLTAIMPFHKAIVPALMLRVKR